jgi:AAA+ ATPase superfamily predicted ATPase
MRVDVQMPVRKLIGRSKELKYLEQCRGMAPAEIVAVIGEEHCGKSKLLSNFCSNSKHPGIYLSLGPVHMSDPQVGSRH